MNPAKIPESPQLNRVEVWILPTKIIDRFGNTVTYTYDSINKWQLKTRTATDGTGSARTITFTYVTPGSTASNLVAAVSDGTRTWHYTYDDPTSSSAQLQTVTLPDQSSWSLGEMSQLLAGISYLDVGSCDDPGMLNQSSLTATLGHPSGASGYFALISTRHARSQVERDCRRDLETGVELVRYPYLFDTYALVRKELFGPMIGTLAWTTSYSAAEPSWDDCEDCNRSKTVSVTDPANATNVHTFGTVWRQTEGSCSAPKSMVATGRNCA